MGKITIKKAKLQDNLFIDVTYEDFVGDNVTNTINRKSTAPVHDDLKNAFHELDIHLALICEEMIFTPGDSLNNVQAQMVQFRETEDRDLFDNPVLVKVASFKATGFTLGGSGDDQGVVIIGRKELTNSKVMNMVSPFTKFNDDYNFGAELAVSIDKCVYEIIEFIVNGKQAPEKQLKFDFDPEEEDVMGVDFEEEA